MTGLSAADFNYVATLVRREASIILAPGKEYLVEARLASVARQVGAASVGDLVAAVQRTADPARIRQIVNALTTNETSWFRDREPFDALADVVVPELVKSRAAARRIRVWSAACSSGQEPYSLAMTLQEALPADWGYDIHATDFSTDMIKRAQLAEFSQVEVNRGLPVQRLVRYFERVGAHWRVIPSLRGRVTFQQLNLTGPLPPLPQFDVIFLRNVLIYFDVPTKRAVLHNVARLLRPDGWLFLGAAETTIGLDSSYERVAAGRASAYRLRSMASTGATGKG